MDLKTFENTRRRGRLGLIDIRRDPSFRTFSDPSCQLEVIASYFEFQRRGRASLFAFIALLTIPAGEMLRPPLIAKQRNPAMPLLCPFYYIFTMFPFSPRKLAIR